MPSPRVALIGAPILGALLGITGAFLHAGRTTFLGISWPWGLVLAFLMVVTSVRAATVAARRRAGGILLTLGWLIPTVISAIASGDGDLGLQANWRSTTYLFATVIVASTLMVLSPPKDVQ